MIWLYFSESPGSPGSLQHMLYRLGDYSVVLCFRLVYIVGPPLYGRNIADTA